jgi:biopolymer transport protein ExbD
VKFPRNARIFRGRLDVAPFATVFFLLAMFLFLTSLVYTPGVALRLPTAQGLPGTDQPSVSVAIDANGRLYFENQLIAEPDLARRLSECVKKAGEPLLLLVQADKAVTYDQLIHLTTVGQKAGITSAWLATLPRPLSGPGQTPAP